MTGAKTSPGREHCLPPPLNMAFKKLDGTPVINRDAPVVGHYQSHNPRRDAINRAFNRPPQIAHLHRTATHHEPLAKIDGRRAISDPRKRDWVGLNCHAYVMGCNRRPGLVLPFLADQSHTLHIGADYPLTPDVAPMDPIYAQGSPLLSNYRVYRGHQDICDRFLQTSDEYCLIFEDDAVPNTADWPNIVNECLSRMETNPDLDIFSLYGRSFTRRRFSEVGRTNDERSVLQLSDPTARTDVRGGKHHVYGSMVYLISRAGARKIRALDWSGTPCDVIFWDSTNFVFLDPSPFDHDRQQGSLLFPASCPPRKK